MTRTLCNLCGALVLMAGMVAAQQPVAQPSPRRMGAGRPIPGPRPVVTPRPSGQVPTAMTPAQTRAVPQPRQPQPNPAPVKPQQPGAAAQAPVKPAQQPFGPQPAPTPVSLQPMRPADMPPVPPEVTYRDGMLTVQALNCTMASLLQTIRNKTGIQFEGTEYATGRVAISMGPAPEGEVLAGIFGGAPLDYVVIGREDSPSVVQRVILSPKRNAGAMNAGVPAQPPPPTPQAQVNEGGGEEEVPDEQASGDVEPQDTPVQPPEVNAQQNQQPNQPQGEQQQAPKTPEQLLQELKEMQQRQAEQQGQAPPNPAQVPRKPPN